MSVICIFTLPGDHHSHAVQWMLEQYGHDVIRVFPYDLCEGDEWKFNPSSGILSLNHSGSRRDINIDAIDAVWFRRISTMMPLDPDGIDLQERAAAETELGHLVTGVATAIELNSFAVNPMGSMARSGRKVCQLHLAKSIGFSIPDTIVTNEIQEIEKFYGNHDQRMAYKPLVSFVWEHENNYSNFAPTTEMTDLEIFKEANVQMSPAIYQEVVEKCGEVRATVMGKSIFAWVKKPRGNSNLDHIDWRQFEGSKVINEAIELPKKIQEMCFSMMKALGIVYGAFDFAITSEGEWVFFEVNPTGQFLFGDSLDLGLNQLDAFSKFLVSQTPEFSYTQTANSLSYNDYLNESDYETDLADEIEYHHEHFLRYCYAPASVKF